MNLSLRGKFEKYYLWLLVLVIFSMVVGLVKITNIAVAASFVLWIILSGKKGILLALKSPYFWCFSILYFLNIIGLLYSENIPTAGKQLVLQLPLLLIPLMFCYRKFNELEIHLLLVVFVIICFIASVIGFAGGYHLYINNNYDSGFLYSNNITYLINKQAVYFAVYINVAIVASLYLIKVPGPIIPQWFFFLLTGFFVMEMFMLASRISLGTLIALAGLALIVYIIKTKKLMIGLSLAFVGTIIVIGLAILFPKTVNRFESIMNTSYKYENTNPVNHFNAENQENNWNGLTIRLAIWNICKEIIAENPVTGVGTGDYKDVLMEKYGEFNFYFASERRLNTHNQYLQVVVSFGLAGLFLFLVGLFYLEYSSIRNGNYLYAAVGFIFLMAFITETFLHRTNGVMLFSIMGTLTFFNYRKY